MKVSVVIPYNKDRGYLDEAIKSVEAQTYTDLELILSHSKASSGVNMQNGINKATGELICYLCDDDLLTPNSIEDRVKFMKAYDYDFIHCRGLHYYSKTNTKPYNLTNPQANFSSCIENNGIMGGTTMYRTGVLKREGWQDYWTACEWATHLDLLSKGYTLGFLNKVVYLYRRHKGQKSIGNLSQRYQAKRQKVKDEIRSIYTSNSSSTPRH